MGRDFVGRAAFASRAGRRRHDRRWVFDLASTGKFGVSSLFGTTAQLCAASQKPGSVAFCGLVC